MQGETNDPVRIWDGQFRMWKDNGYEIDMLPGVHPTANHKWNTDPQGHLDEFKIPYNYKEKKIVDTPADYGDEY